MDLGVQIGQLTKHRSIVIGHPCMITGISEKHQPVSSRSVPSSKPRPSPVSRQQIAWWFAITLLVVSVIPLTACQTIQMAIPTETPAFLGMENATISLPAVTNLTATILPTPTHTPTRISPPGPEAGEVRVSEIDGMAMVYIPAGSYMMGSTEQEVNEAFDRCDAFAT
jgi:hypothetical protein